MLEEVFGCESDQYVEIPNLKIAIFVELPSLCKGIGFESVKDRLVKNCPKLSLTSSSTRERMQQIICSGIEGSDVTNRFIKWTLRYMLADLYYNDSKAQETRNQNSTANVTEDFPIETGNELTSSQVNTNESIHANIEEYNQHEIGIESNEFVSVEIQTTETSGAEQEFVEKVPGLEIPSTTISSTDSELIGSPGRSPSDIFLYKTHSLEIKKNVEEGTTSAYSKTIASPIGSILGPLVTSECKIDPQEIKRIDEEGTTSAYSKTIALSICSKSVSSLLGPLVTSKCKIDPQEDGEGQIAMPSFSIINIEPATTKDVGDGELKETHKSVVIHSEINAPENHSQITEDPSFVYIVKREIEQLVSNKHLALENLSLLTNFLAKHPSVHLTDNTLSDRYKGFAYTCLAELLKFLQTHSVLDVLGSSHSEFVELLQDVRSCGFNRDWLDDVERRALFHEDPLQKLLDSKHALIQHLEDLKHAMNQHLEHLKHQLEEQEAQILEVRASLSTPLGY